MFDVVKGPRSPEIVSQARPPNSGCETWDVLPCRRSGPDLFFAERPEDVELAKALCASCPVRQRCLEGALERREPWGVWGGQLLVAGEIVARKRPRGRPRKEVAAAA